MATDQNAQFEMLDLLRGVDADAESLFSLLDHSGAMEGDEVQRAVYQLRLSVAQALGDRERAKVAQESLAELGSGAETAESAPTHEHRPRVELGG